jgi:NADH:ubiquinone oxidoreductase subunit 6 (subunit J)
MAIFGLWLVHNLGRHAFSDYWPFFILLVAVLVAVGFLRARASADKEK